MTLTHESAARPIASRLQAWRLAAWRLWTTPHNAAMVLLTAVVLVQSKAWKIRGD